MNKLLKQILILTCLVALLVLPYFVFAKETVRLAAYDPTKSDNTMKDVLEKIGQEGGYDQQTNQYTASRIAGTAVKAFLSILGVIFIFLALYGGYIYMMARGNEEEVEKGVSIIRQAIVGLIIIVGAWALWSFIENYFLYN